MRDRVFYKVNCDFVEVVIKGVKVVINWCILFINFIDFDCFYM